MIRPFRSETERYGEYSKAGEFVYDHPFQWGSKRTGPDLAREGVITSRQYKPDSWHYNHMLDPQTLNEQSIMPKYPWIVYNDMKLADLQNKINAMITLGVPYPRDYAGKAMEDLEIQAIQIVDGLKTAGIETQHTKEIIAMIAYLQRLGTDIMVPETEEEAAQESE
jgi:cytochrome c oxidase cbb3-type subunit I/II